MKDFDAVKLWLQENQNECSDNLKQRFKRQVLDGVKKGVALGLESVTQGVRNHVQERFVKEVVEREITKELSKGLSIGLPKSLFEKLYKSYTELNTKLAARDPSAGGYDQPWHERLTRTEAYPDTNQEVPNLAASQEVEQYPRPDDGGTRGWRREPCEDSEASSELSEERNEESLDQCCVCSTLASEEELMTTECCAKVVGSICFEEALQETGKCCLCHETQNSVESSKLTLHPVHDPTYKFHFVKTQDQAEGFETDEQAMNIADKPETGIDCPSQQESGPSLATEKYAETANGFGKRSKRTARASEACNLKGKPAQDKGTPSNGSTKPSQESHATSIHKKLQRLDPLEHGSKGSSTTATWVLKLFDQAVISYLKELSVEELLSTVYEALKQGLPSTFHGITFFGALITEGGHVRIKYGIVQGQAPNLMGGTASWAGILENFVRARSATYSVMMHNVEIDSMKLFDEFQKTRAIEELVSSNASAMQFLSQPDDVRFIRWTMKERNLQTAKIGSVTMGLATAAQANEVIARGLLWKGQRRYCVKEGPKKKLVQCDNCQGLGHAAEYCSSCTRCQTCAEGHQANECPLGLTPEPRSLKRALCGGRHSARDYYCTVKRGEEERLRLENCSYPTDTDDVPAASEAAEKESHPAPTTSKTPLPATLSPRSATDDLYPKLGNSTLLVEQRLPFPAFDEQIILQQPDGSKYSIPARRIESPVGRTFQTP